MPGQCHFFFKTFFLLTVFSRSDRNSSDSAAFSPLHWCALSQKLKALSAYFNPSTFTARISAFSLIFPSFLPLYSRLLSPTFSSGGHKKKSLLSSCMLPQVTERGPAGLEYFPLSLQPRCSASPLFTQSAVGLLRQDRWGSGLNRMSKLRRTRCDKPLPVSFVRQSSSKLGKAALTRISLTPHPSCFLIHWYWHHTVWITSNRHTPFY